MELQGEVTAQGGFSVAMWGNEFRGGGGGPSVTHFAPPSLTW